MANTIRIKRRASGASGAPSSLKNAELAYSEVDNILYYGKGSSGANGTATTIEAIGGPGAFPSRSTTRAANYVLAGPVSGSAAAATWRGLAAADIPDVSKHNIDYDGTRAIDGGAAEFREGISSGGEAIKFRC